MQIIVYGAGNRGKHVLNTIKKYSEIEVIAYIDKKKEGIDGHLILDMNSLKPYDKNIPIIIALTDWTQILKICRDLQKLGFTKIYHYLHKNYCAINNFLTHECIELKDITERTLMYAEMHLVDFCNLNCKGCTHFSALFEKKLPNVKNRIKDVKRISKIFDNVIVFSMMGGEPLLCADIKEYIEEIRKIFPKTALQLVTNGLLISKIPDDVLECIADNYIIVEISEYRPTHKIIDQIKERLEKYHIDYYIRGYNSKRKFVKPLSLSQCSIYPQKCMSSGCINIWEGKIAKCPTLMYVKKLNEKFNLNLPEDGVIQLEEHMDGVELLDRLNQKVPLCQHCVEYEMEWECCGTDITMQDFVLEE